jgi:hypothetical protein
MLGQAKENKMKNISLMLAVAVSFNPKLIKKIDSCALVNNAKTPTVYVLKQWHLPPSVNTKENPVSKSLPQTKNQTQIFDQLSEWTEKSDIDTAIAEGCEGSIDSKMKEVFQGWSYADLEVAKTQKDFDSILSHPVVKLKVRYPNVNAVCGDSLSEIKKSQLALSDSRADVGYLARLSENKNQPASLTPYLESVVEAYHLRPDVTLADAQKALSTDLKKSLSIFQDSTHERDLSFIRKVNTLASQKPSVIVIGGLHASDLKQILEDKKMNCTIFEPLAYQNDEEALSKQLKTLIK